LIDIKFLQQNRGNRCLATNPSPPDIATTKTGANSAQFFEFQVNRGLPLDFVSMPGVPSSETWQ